MMTSTTAQFAERILVSLSRALAAALHADGPEEALRVITSLSRDLLGDENAQHRAGALKPGEHQFSAAGAFFVTPDRRHNLLLAEVNFPPEQHRLKIDIRHGHPGWVVEHEKPLLLANTDHHTEFKQILKTARMGSAIFAPMVWRGRLIGQLVTASQARHTYAEHDLETLVTLARVATPIWIAHGGEELVQQLGPS
jgi:hypothetical protein